MKKSIFAALCIGCGALLFNSCGNNASSSVNGVLNAIPAEADFVGVLDVKALMASAEVVVNGSEFVLPKYIENELTSADLDDIESMQEAAVEFGVDLSALGIFGVFDAADDDDHVFVVAKILDDKAFGRTILDAEDETSEIINKITYYYAESYYDRIYLEAVKYDGYAYVLTDGRYFDDIDQAVDVVEPLIKSKKSYADTKVGSVITDGNLGGFAVSVPSKVVRELRQEGVPGSIANALRDTYIAGNMNLDGVTMTSSIMAYNADGSPMDLNEVLGEEVQGVKLSSTIDSGLLKYLPQNSVAAYGMNIEGVEWHDALDWYADQVDMSRKDRGAIPMVASYLEKLGGNIVVGFGFDGGLDEMAKANSNMQVEPFDYFSVGVVVETQKGGANDLMEQLVGLAEMADVSFDEIKDGIMIELPDMGCVYAYAVEDDVIVISTEEKVKARSNNLSRVGFGDVVVGSVVAIDKDLQVLKDLGIGFGIEGNGGYSASPLALTGRVELTGVSGKALKHILQATINVMNDMADIVEAFEDEVYSESIIEEYEDIEEFACGDDAWDF